MADSLMCACYTFDMEHPDFEPTQPEFLPTRPDWVYSEPDETSNVTREEYLEELDRHRHSVQILEEQSKDMTRSEEERQQKWSLWINEKLDLLEKEEKLKQGKIIFKNKS